MQHKQRIIDGIEKVFEGYAKDEELAGLMCAEEIIFQLFPRHNNQTYYLSTGNGKTSGIVSANDLGIISSSSSINAAQSYVEYLHHKKVEPLTKEIALERLDQNLGRRVRAIKQYYATLN
ncbi:MAG: hypothetical protein AABY26_07175, partial [Nanoarchaeota archaeon]